jgi:hypothetical protein
MLCNNGGSAHGNCTAQHHFLVTRLLQHGLVVNLRPSVLLAAQTAPAAPFLAPPCYTVTLPFLQQLLAS